MQGSKINHEEQIQVVIRLKPSNQDNNHNKCVYTSEAQDNQLIVETINKKQYFVFDNVADELCDQQTLYEKIGKQAVMSSIQGYNCCIFAYGQTGAGKTYSILGKTQDLINNIYAESRGVLPRLLNELFDWIKTQGDRCSVICTYMEIYNEQIFDLLNTEVKVRQIRQDFKKGVFVDGLSEQQPKSYSDSMDILMKGLKNRKIATTNMNNESSRSHTIFTINLQCKIEENDNVKLRKSKIHIVDLAGSERAKLTKVEGDRLKEGCNINKSLHVLGNVINALVESSKKKKHIPFRDSKLTYILKDSLGGNSITKLLANIDPNKKYITETLSTLMFAKRAKIIKMKVEVNQNMTENFDGLRKQIKKLRQQLAEARYIKNQQKLTQKNSNEQQDTFNWEKLVDTSGFDFVKNDKVLQIFEENETHYKALIEIYQQRLKQYNNQNNLNVNQNNFGRKQINLHQQWKTMEKKIQTLSNLIRSFPAFTRIFRQNMMLKNEFQKDSSMQLLNKRTMKDTSVQFKRIESLIINDLDIGVQSNRNQRIVDQQVNKIINCYENVIKEMENKMKYTLQKLQTSYNELLQQNKQKDQKIKQLKKKKQLPPQLQTLQNENEYLKLNILELESEIVKYEQNQRKYQIQLKKAEKDHNHNHNHHHNNSLKESNQIVFNDKYLCIQEINSIMISLEEVKKQAQQQIKEIEEQKETTQKLILQLKDQIIKISHENRKLSKQCEHYISSNKQLKKKLSQLLKISSETEINKEFSNTNTFWTNQESNFTQQFMMQGDLFIDKKQLDDRNKLLGLLEKQQEKRNKVQQKLEQQVLKSLQLSKEIMKMHQQYNKEISLLKIEIKNYQIQRKEYLSEIQTTRMRNRLAQEQFGKSITNIIQQYRELNKLPFCQSPRININQLSSINSLKGCYSPIINHRKKQSREAKDLGIDKQSKIEEKNDNDNSHRKNVLKSSMIIGRLKDANKKDQKQKIVYFPPKKKQKK